MNAMDLSRPSLVFAGGDFGLHAYVKFCNIDDHAVMHALADQIALVARAYFEFDITAVNRDHFGRGRHAHANRCGRDMGNVEMRAETLVTRRQKVFYRGKRCRFEQIDHHGCCQYTHTTGTYKWRSVFIGDRYCSVSDGAQRDGEYQRHAAQSAAIQFHLTVNHGRAAFGTVF